MKVYVIVERMCTGNRFVDIKAEKAEVEALVSELVQVTEGLADYAILEKNIKANLTSKPLQEGETMSELEQRVKKLEKKVAELEGRVPVQSEGNVNEIISRFELSFSQAADDTPLELE